jgi:hypothetical protein
MSNFEDEDDMTPLSPLKDSLIYRFSPYKKGQGAGVGKEEKSTCIVKGKPNN